MQSSSYAYIADTVCQERRSFRFAMVQGVLYAATSLGNLGIGYCLQLGYLDSFTTIAFVYLSSSFYVMLALPESRRRASEKLTHAKRGGVCATLYDVVGAAFGVFAIYSLPDRERRNAAHENPGEGCECDTRRCGEKRGVRSENCKKAAEVLKAIATTPSDNKEYFEDTLELRHHVERILNLRLLVTIN